MVMVVSDQDGKDADDGYAAAVAYCRLLLEVSQILATFPPAAELQAVLRLTWENFSTIGAALGPDRRGRSGPGLRIQCDGQLW